MDKIVNSSGYVTIWMPEHPHANNGYVLEHRYVVECAIGRVLEPHEVVHHINEVKTDNRIGNLYLCTQDEHVQIHNRFKVFSSERKKAIRSGLRKSKSRGRSNKKI